MKFSRKSLPGFVCFLLCLNTIQVPKTANAQEQTDFIGILKHVYETHPSLNAARERLNETKELLPQARAGWMPSANAETSIYATDIDNNNFGGGDGATTKDLSLTLDQPIWRGGQTFAETARAKELIKAGEATLHRAEQDVLMRATIACLHLIRDRDLYSLRLKNRDNLGQESTAAKERFENGVLTVTDVEQSSARLARAQANLVNAEQAYEISKAEFNEVIGFEPPEYFGMPDIDFQFPSTLDDMLAQAETANPDLWAARFEEKAAEHNADATFSELLPQVSAFASYNKQYDPQPGIIQDSRTETIGLRAVVPLYQGGATRSRLREARHAAKRSLYEAEETQRGVYVRT